MVPSLRFNLAETTSAWPPQGGGQAQQDPTQQKLLQWKLNVKKTQRRGSDKKPGMMETGAVKNKLKRKPTCLGLRLQKASG